MKILCLDTTAVTASAAVTEDDTLLAEYTVAGGGRSHCELLMPMVHSLLSSLSLTADDIQLFATCAGPGSFTGVRIGISLIKGLAFGRGKPCAAVSSLWALAEGLSPLEGLICPVMDARRQQVYNALFRREGDTLTRLTPDRAIGAAELAEEIARCYPGETCMLAGNGIGVAAPALCERGVSLFKTPYLLEKPHAAAAARCALRMWERGELTSDSELRPLYLRLPQAERERLERLKKQNETD